MSDADFYIAVATVAPLFVLTVGLSTEGFRNLFYVLLGFTNGNKVPAGLITMTLGVLTLLFGTICEVMSLVALYQNGVAQNTRNLILAIAILLVVVSVIVMFLILLYSLIVEGDAAKAKFEADELARKKRLQSTETGTPKEEAEP